MGYGDNEIEEECVDTEEIAEAKGRRRHDEDGVHGSME